MRGIKAGLDAIKKQNPNFVDIAAHEVWRSRNPQKVADPLPTPGRWDFGKAKAAVQQRAELMKKRETLRIGMPRVLNMYLFAPLFSALSGEPGPGAGEPGLLRVHRPGHVSPGRRPRRHRSLLPVEDRHSARLQPDLPEAS